MLFILTEEIQHGKTRWLEHAVSELEKRDCAVAGVVSPGVWRDCVDQDGNPCYEKLGIDCLLLPHREQLHMALRADLAQPQDEFDLFRDNPRMMWKMSSTSVAAVNAHFDRLALQNTQSSKTLDACGVLIVDEIGWVELQGRGGFTSAVRLLDQGPSEAFPHALVVSRASLCDQVKDRFEYVWNDLCIVHPDDHSLDMLLEYAAGMLINEKQKRR